MNEQQNAGEQIYEIMQNSFKHSDMLPMKFYPALQKKTLLSSKVNLYTGLQIYFSVIISTLAQFHDMGMEIDSMAEKPAKRSIKKYKSLSKSTPILNLAKGKDTEPQIVQLLKNSSNFFYKYKVSRNPHYNKKNYPDSNKEMIVNIEGIKFYFNPHEISLEQVLRINIPALQNFQDEYNVEIDSDNRVSEY